MTYKRTNDESNKSNNNETNTQRIRKNVELHRTKGRNTTRLTNHRSVKGATSTTVRYNRLSSEDKKIKYPPKDSNTDNREEVESVLLNPVGKNKLRVIALGGLSEVGKNMYVVEYDGEIVVFDCGVSFGEHEMFGIGFMMPNIEYLKKRRKDIRALVLTDGAMSHIGALPHTLKEIGNPVIYSRALTKLITEKEHRMYSGLQKVNWKEIEKEETIAISDKLQLTFFSVSSETPNTFAVSVDTPDGSIVHTGSIRVEHKDGVVYESESKKYECLKNKKIIAMMSGSVNAEKNGFALSDKHIADEVVRVVREADGRVIIPLFASQAKRNALVVDGIVQSGRNVYVHGSTVMNSLEAAQELGHINIQQKALSGIQEMEDDVDTKKTAIIIATEENETYSILSKASFDQNRYIKIYPDDTVIFPDAMIPTQASALQSLKNRLSRFGAVISAYSTNDVKALGHAAKEELLWLHKQIRAEYVIPIEGYHYMLVAHGHIAHESGVDMDKIVFLENNVALDIDCSGKKHTILKNKLPTRSLCIDGKTPCTIHDVVLQDRKTISQEGIFIVVIRVDQKKLILKNMPDIISRGFIYLKESKDLMMRARLVIKKTAEQEMKEEGEIQMDSLKKAIRKALKSLLMAETSKQPVIVPVIFT